MSKNNPLKKSAKSLTNCKKSNCNKINPSNKDKIGKCLNENCKTELANFQKEFSHVLRNLANAMNKKSPKKSPKNSPKKSPKKSPGRNVPKRKAKKTQKKNPRKPRN